MRRRGLRLTAGALLATLVPAAAQAQGRASAPPSATDASASAPDNSSGFTHFFGNTRHLQALGDQVGMGKQTGPLPFTLSGNVQKWTSGPPQQDLYTQVMQATYALDSQWKLVGQQLYQQQASIELWNFVGGVNYSPTEDFSINATAGAGVHTRYTYEWAAYVSPQYTLPFTIGGEKRIAIGANLTYESYELGAFVQVTPRVSLNVAPWLPQLQIAYAFGDFDDSTPVNRTQYYQPQAVEGFNLTAVFRPFDPVYVVVSYLPENRNYIAGNYADQSTLGATLHLSLTDNFRLSSFYQNTWYVGGGDYAVGGGLSVSF